MQINNSTISKVLALTFLCFFATRSSANDWDDYRSLIDDYYFLDDQAFTEIACRVSMTTLDPAYWRAQMQPYEKYIEVDENLSSFEITYRKNAGITITEPHFVVRLKTVDGVSDPALVRSGIDSMNRGAARQISGARQVIEGTFNELSRPLRKDFSGMEIATSKDGSIVEYTRNGKHVTQIYSNGVRKSSHKVAGGTPEIESFDEFTDIAGKRALSKTLGTIKQGDITTKIEMTVQYQQIGSVNFPSALDSQVNLENSMMKQNIKISISFDQCVSK